MRERKREKERGRGSDKEMEGRGTEQYRKNECKREKANTSCSPFYLLPY